MNKKSLIGIGIGVLVIGIFLVALTNPNLRENKETWFGFIDTSPESVPTIIHTEDVDVEKVIVTFKEKYADFGVREYPDSKGIPWKYTAKSNDFDVELILGDDRVILRSYSGADGSMICMVVNPFPQDIFDWCPPKW